jgi:hypothetical protein
MAAKSNPKGKSEASAEAKKGAVEAGPEDRSNDEETAKVSDASEPPVAKSKKKTVKATPERPSYHEELAKEKEGLNPDEQEMLETAYRISKGRG